MEIQINGQLVGIEVKTGGYPLAQMKKDVWLTNNGYPMILVEVR